MSTRIEMRGVQTLLPRSLIDHIREAKPETEPALQALDKQMTTAATLVIKLILNLIKQVQQNKLRELDCNPGDAGCQMRATIIPFLLTSTTVLEELSQLEITAKEISFVLQKRRSGLSNYMQLKFNDPTAQFFEKHLIERLRLSKEVCYLLDCRMLKVTKVIDHIEPNGVIVTKTSIDQLSKLCDVNGLPHEYRNQLVQKAAARISEDSLSYMREIASRLNMSALVQRVLQVVRQNKPGGNIVPKSFGCLFHEMQVMLTHLCEEEALIAIKAVVKEGKSPYFFLKPPGPGKEFALIDDQTVQCLPDKNIRIFEGVIASSLTNTAFASKVQEIGFSRLILICAAQESPFEHGSILEDVQDHEARAEIERYRKMAPEVGCVKGQNPLLLLDHVFCNNLQDELGGKQC